MPIAPMIDVYSLNPDDKGKKLETLLTPAEFFILAKVMSFLMEDFVQQPDENIKQVVNLLKLLTSDEYEPSKKADQLFEWYCRECAGRHQVVTELMGDSKKVNVEGWNAQPQDFHPGIRRFFGLFFQEIGSIQNVFPSYVSGCLAIFGVFKLLLADYIKGIEESLPDYDLNEAGFDFAIEGDNLPPYAQSLNTNQFEKAYQKLERLLHYLILAEKKGQEFSFEPIRESLKEEVRLKMEGEDDLVIGFGEDGKIFFTDDLKP